jgi:uncharacterized protein
MMPDGRTDQVPRAADHHVLRPLAEVGMTNWCAYGRASAGLPVAGQSLRRPARVPNSAPPSSDASQAEPDRTRRVALRQLGFSDLRVRHHDEIARVELPPADLVRASLIRSVQMLAAVRGAGFRFVTVILVVSSPSLHASMLSPDCTTEPGSTGSLL